MNAFVRFQLEAFLWTSKSVGGGQCAVTWDARRVMCNKDEYRGYMYILYIYKMNNIEEHRIIFSYFEVICWQIASYKLVFMFLGSEIWFQWKKKQL